MYSVLHQEREQFVPHLPGKGKEITYNTEVSCFGADDEEDHKGSQD